MSLSPDAVRLLQDSIASMTGVRVSAEDAASIHALIPPPVTAAPRTSARDPNRTVTILLTDLRGFTAFSELIPACEVFDVLNRHLCRMCEIAVSNGGMIDKFIGDSVMVLFGIEEHGEKDALSAVTCAVQMQSAMDEFNRENSAIGLAPLYMGIGIHTGRVAAGRLGSSLHSEFTVIGQEVSLASRIESFSLRGQVLVSEATYDLCARWLETSEPMDVQVKGKKDAVRLREVLSIPSLGLNVPDKNKRKSPRVAVNLPFDYRLMANKIVLPNSRNGVVRDLGYQGMLVEIQDEIITHSDIVLGLDLPLIGMQAQGVYAKVKSIRQEKTSHLVGLEFTSIGESEEQAIRRMVQVLMQG